LEVRQCLQDVDCGSFSIKGGEVLAELFFKVKPVKKLQPMVFGGCLEFKFLGCPAAGLSGLHVGHGPDDLCGFIIKGFWA